MTEGWLVLTEESLCLYDRDPRGVTRKPIYRFLLNEVGVAYVILPSVNRSLLPLISATSLAKAFGIQVHSRSHTKQLSFVASTLQSKIDWVEAIQKVLSGYTTLTPVRSRHATKDTPRSGGRELNPRSGGRELKAVSIVPVTTPLKVGGGPNMSANEGSDLDLSVRSSMLNSSSSDASFI